MYIHDIHILYYFFIGLLGIGVGQFMNWANDRLENHEKVFTKEFWIGYLPHMKINCKLIFSIAIIYIALLYFFGWQIELLEYMILAPMFLAAFIIDYRKQIIPNRLTLTIFEVGLVFAFISGISSVNIFVDRLLGMVTGAGIFLLITLIGGAIAGKEAMGFGDVKLMGALGLYFGLSNIIAITLVSFLIGAILSVMLLATKIKKMDEYIPFGPFIVIGTFVSIFVPFETIKYALLMFFTLGLYAK